MPHCSLLLLVLVKKVSTDAGRDTGGSEVRRQSYTLRGSEISSGSKEGLKEG
jgi:hypothetical protein